MASAFAFAQPASPVHVAAGRYENMQPIEAGFSGRSIQSGPVREEKKNGSKYRETTLQYR